MMIGVQTLESTVATKGRTESFDIDADTREGSAASDDDSASSLSWNSQEVSTSQKNKDKPVEGDLEEASAGGGAKALLAMLHVLPPQPAVARTPLSSKTRPFQPNKTKLSASAPSFNPTPLGMEAWGCGGWVPPPMEAIPWQGVDPTQMPFWIDPAMQVDFAACPVMPLVAEEPPTAPTEPGVVQPAAPPKKESVAVTPEVGIPTTPTRKTIVPQSEKAGRARWADLMDSDGEVDA